MGHPKKYDDQTVNEMSVKAVGMPLVVRHQVPLGSGQVVTTTGGISTFSVDISSLLPGEFLKTTIKNHLFLMLYLMIFNVNFFWSLVLSFSWGCQEVDGGRPCLLPARMQRQMPSRSSTDSHYIFPPYFVYEKFVIWTKWKLFDVFFWVLWWNWGNYLQQKPKKFTDRLHTNCISVGSWFWPFEVGVLAGCTPCSGQWRRWWMGVMWFWPIQKWHDSRWVDDG